MLIKYCDNYVLFDLETTGLSPETDEIVEISAIKVEKGEVIDEYSTLVNPGIHIPFFTSSVNGITDDMVKNAPSGKEALKGFISFIGDSILAGHNIRNFDLKFIQRDAVRYFGKPITNEYVDTLMLAKRCLPKLESRSLQSLSAHYKISYEGAHRALADCYINKQVYDCLGKEMANPSADSKNQKVCPRCGNILRQRSGIYGDFWGCASYPECKYTRNIVK